VSGGRRTAPPTPQGAHFLSRALAARLVAEADVDPDDLVFDLGAGHGVITAALAATGARTVAVERDPKLARSLERRFAGAARIRIVHGDVRTIPLPHKAFRVVANIPFGVTTELLGRLINGPLSAADIVVADGVSRGLTAARPGKQRILRWSVGYEFQRGRSLSARCFRPPPSVDAATLVIRRRSQPLLRNAAHRRAFEGLLTAAYKNADQPWEQGARGFLTHRQAVRLAAAQGIALGRPASWLSVHDWAALAEIAAAR